MPLEYCLEMKNRFTNAAGGAEKRQGIDQTGATVDGQPTLDGVHELIKKDGTAILFVSGQGKIFKETSGVYTQVKGGLDTSTRLRSVQMGDRLIFYNGVDRNIYTTDGDTFTELLALIEQGATTTGTNPTHLIDTDVSNWVSGTDVAVNDLIYNKTLNAYAIVTEVTASGLNHTNISTSAAGMGVAVSAQGVGHAYQIIDLVEMNIVADPVGSDPDNVATLASGSSSTIVRVSGVDFSETEARMGDWIRNTTKAAVTQITSVSADLNVTAVSGQAVGDSVLFFKSAMPITKAATVHFGRLYMVDERDQRKIRITGANDPQDMTTDAGTLDSATFSFGDLQSKGDTVVAIGSFQRFFIMCGKQNLFAFSGTNPIVSVSGDTSDFVPIGLFPIGTVSPDGLVSLHNDMVFASNDGLQSVAIVNDASNLNRANLSEAIRVTLREELKNASESEIQAIHYPRRSWLLLKVGSLMHCYSYTTFLGDPNKDVFEPGSWSLFDGKFAQQNAYYVRASGDLICAGAGGKVYIFDQGGYDDDGQSISTEYKTAWLSLDEPKRTVRHKMGVYIKPIFDAGAQLTHTILAESGFDAENTDQVIVSTSGGATPLGLATIGEAVIGGSSINNQKYPLRWKGEVVRITFSNDHSEGPDILDRFTLYANVWGRK